MSLRIGDTVGDYVILEELGSGGAGQVFKVEHIITRRHEAIKVLAGTTQSVRESFQQFLQEIRLQASLRHPNIAQVHNAFWTGEHLIMVMELLDGAPLERLMQQSRIPLEDGVAILRQVLSALTAAHAHGVVHRDVSPSNIFVGRDGHVKLTDFGLAAMTADLRTTPNGSFLGSFHYMSPEQVRGAGPVDERSDVYSCGAVLYELVTGHTAFNYDNAFSLMRAHVEQTPLTPRSMNPNIPPALDEIAMRAMAKEPERRFASAQEFRDALDALDPFTLCLAAAGVVDEAPVEAAPAAQVATPPRATRWKLAAGLILGALLAMAAGFAALRWPVSAPPPPPVIAPPPLEAAPVEPPPLVEPPLPVPPPPALDRPAPAKPVRRTSRPVHRYALTPAAAPEPAKSTITETPPKVEAPPGMPAAALSPAVVIAPPAAPTVSTTPPSERKGGVRRFFQRINPLRRKPADAPKPETPSQP